MTLSEKILHSVTALALILAAAVWIYRVPSLSAARGDDTGTAYDSSGSGGGSQTFNGGQVDNDIDMSQGTGRLLLFQSNTGTQLSFGNPAAFDTGLRRRVDSGNRLEFVQGGFGTFQFQSDRFQGVFSNDAPGIRNISTAEGTPVYLPDRDDLDTGMGGAPSGGSVTFLVNGTITLNIRDAYYIGPLQSAANPSEPVACGATTVGARQHVEDTNDGLHSKTCVCINVNDGLSYDWRRADDEATACPFY